MCWYSKPVIGWGDEPTTSWWTVTWKSSWAASGPVPAKTSRTRVPSHELGVNTFEAYAEGANLYYRHGGLQTYQGDLPPVNATTRADLLRTISTLNEMAAGVPAAQPWAATQAATWDVQTVASWIAAQGYTDEATLLANLLVRAV